MRIILRRDIHSYIKEGSVVSGLVDAFATGTSIMLQYGVPLEVLVNKFSHTRFEPSGYTNNPKIPIAKSILDYIFRWLSMKFIDKDDPLPGIKIFPQTVAVEAGKVSEPEVGKIESKSDSMIAHKPDTDAPPCPDCGL
jgi:ribonucleoside-diphosphate reductase alpha chain